MITCPEMSMLRLKSKNHKQIRTRKTLDRGLQSGHIRHGRRRKRNLRAGEPDGESDRKPNREPGDTRGTRHGQDQCDDTKIDLPEIGPEKSPQGFRNRRALQKALLEGFHHGGLRRRCLESRRRHSCPQSRKNYLHPEKWRERPSRNRYTEWLEVRPL